MTREDAYKAMLAGNKITHQYFSNDEWYKTDNRGAILAEDGVNHTLMFWDNTQPWRSDGWEILQDTVPNKV